MQKNYPSPREVPAFNQYRIWEKLLFICLNNEQTINNFLFITRWIKMIILMIHRTNKNFTPPNKCFFILRCIDDSLQSDREVCWKTVSKNFAFFVAQKITVTTTNTIGTVEENFSLLGPSFTVYDATRKVLCNIFGPNVCSCCMYKEAQFQVTCINLSTGETRAINCNGKKKCIL